MLLHAKFALIMLIYPESNINSLEFHHIRNWLEAKCATKRGQEYAAQLQPKTTYDAIHDELNVANDALMIRLEGPAFPQTPDVSLKEVIQLLPIENSSLSQETFHELRLFYISFNRILFYLKKHRVSLPHFFSIVRGIEPNRDLPKKIDVILDQNGIVKSSASQKLATIRRNIEQKRSEATKVFQRQLRQLQKDGVIEDLAETVSNDRRVLIIPSAYKRQFNGTIHGSTRSGQFSYLEPQGTVQLNNEVAQLKSEETKEIQIILRDLTNEVRPFYEEIYHRFELYGYIDFIRAKGELAYSIDAVKPNLSKSKVINLINARHPILEKKNKEFKKPTVPLNVQMDPDKRLLVISGPNAGGKSVSMKTIGLLQIMVQSGLLVPCDQNSEFSVFKKLMADIGDSQSIENELSTYSSKLTLMKYFIEKSDQHSLVLIDEFGTGSDPDLGGAIAEELLAYLHSVKCFGVVTTHYGNIKVLAQELTGTLNANMRFDKETFSPLYQLEVGRPGSSYTFEVAKIVGLPQSIIDKAKNRVKKEKFEFDKLLNQLQEEKQALKELKTRVYNSGKKQEVSSKKAEQTQERLDAKLKQQTELFDKNSHYVDMGKKFEKIAEEFVRAKDKQKVMNKYFKSFEKEYQKQTSEADKILHKRRERAQRKAQAQQEQQKLEEKASNLKVGDRVRFLKSDESGVIQEIRENKFIIQLGMMSIETSIENIEKGGSKKKKPKQKAGKSKTETHQSVSNQSKKGGTDAANTDKSDSGETKKREEEEKHQHKVEKIKRRMEEKSKDEEQVEKDVKPKKSKEEEQEEFGNAIDKLKDFFNQ